MSAGCRDGGGLAFPDNAAPPASPHGHPRHRRRCRAMGLVERADQRAARARRLRQRVRAMPSLHVGWALWSGWFLFRHARRKTLRGFGLAYPALTTLVVIATGNHYLADAIAAPSSPCSWVRSLASSTTSANTPSGRRPGSARSPLPIARNTPEPTWADRSTPHPKLPPR
ncbi:phosphatase PAP2 family protein [Streptomyces kaempferi]